MSKVSAFGVPVFTPAGTSKKPPVIVQEINNKLEQMGLNGDNVITIQAEQDFYHVFYKSEE